MDYSGDIEVSQVDSPQQNPPTEPLDTEFKRRYPPEGPSDEMLPNARVWKVYRDEATAHDTIMLDSWNKTVDVLLVFAGLFSAVVTAFLVESYKLLKPDNSVAYMSTALYLVVVGSNSSTGSLPAPPPISSLVTPLTRWTNGLWFTSLLLSLGVALLCILIKQWIGEYTARNGASATDPRHWALRHQLYYNAMTAWPVSELVSVLPALLHLSLFLFSAGIVGFLWDLDRALGIWVSILSVSLGIFYAGCTLLPLWIPECPTSTPLVSILRRIFGRVRVLGLKAFVIIHSRLLPWLQPFLLPRQHEHITSTAVSLEGIYITRQSTARNAVQHGVLTWQDKLLLYDKETSTSAVDALLHSRLDQLQADALLWLIFSVPHHDAVAVGIQAIGGLRDECLTLDRLRADDRFAGYDWESAYLGGTIASANKSQEAARIVRSMLRIKCPFALPPRISLRTVSLLFDGMWDSKQLDSRFLWWFYRRYIGGDGYSDGFALDTVSCYAQSLSVTSTIMSVVYAVDMDFHDLLQALARCDIEGFSPSRLTFVRDRVYASAPKSLIRCRHGPPSLALLELLCQMILMPSLSTSRSTLQHLIAAFTCSANLHGDFNRPWVVYEYPFLTQYLGSSLWIEHRPGDLPLYTILLKLLEEARNYYGVPVVLRRLFHALTATLFMCQSADFPHSDAVVKCCLELLDRFINWNELTWNTPPDVVQGILQPMSLPGLSLSLWDILRGTGLDYYMTLELPEKLARALCSVDNGSATTETDMFLSSLRLRDLLEIWHRCVEDPEWNSYGTTINCPDRYLIFHTIQHGAYLRPMWWFDGLRLIHEGGSATDDFERVNQSIHEVEKLMSQQWILCTTCPIALRDRYEYAPSTCGFDPACCVSTERLDIATLASTDRFTTMDEERSP